MKSTMLGLGQFVLIVLFGTLRSAVSAVSAVKEKAARYKIDRSNCQLIKGNPLLPR